MRNVLSLPGRWAENLTLSEAKAEPVRLGDDGGRTLRELRHQRVIAGQGHAACYDWAGATLPSDPPAEHPETDR